MSRLDFAPGPKEIRPVSLRKGSFAFTPKPDRPVSFAALRDAIDRAGYTLYSAEVVVAGTLARDGQRWSLSTGSAGQRFVLDGKNLNKLLADAAPGAAVEITGSWKTAGKGALAYEVVSARAVKKMDGAELSVPLHTPQTRDPGVGTASLVPSSALCMPGSAEPVKPPSERDAARDR